MTERTARLDHLLREEISAIISREIADPRIGFVTITRVEVAPDLGHANVWASVIGSAEERRTTLRALGRAMPYVRHQLGGLHLRRIPRLHVREDDTAERGTRVMHILDELGAGAPDPLAGRPGSLPTPGPLRSQVVLQPAPDAGTADASTAAAPGPSPRPDRRRAGPSRRSAPGPRRRS